MDLDNEPQPDIVLIINGGQASLTEDGYLEGTPELIVEIAASTAAIDAGSKKRAYCRNGVKEYIIWYAFENQLEWMRLVEGEYQVLAPDPNGIVRSQVFPGLWLAVDDLLNHRMTSVLENLQVGLRSLEHQTFMQQLAR